jgi:hypothetical protein
MNDGIVCYKEDSQWFYIVLCVGHAVYMFILYMAFICTGSKKDMIGILK